MSEFKLTRRMRNLILERIIEDRDTHKYDRDQLLVVEHTRIFNKVNQYGDIGTIEVTYSTKGYRALYGFDTLGNISLYAD